MRPLPMTTKELRNALARAKRQREATQAEVWRWDNEIEVIEKLLKQRGLKPR